MTSTSARKDHWNPPFSLFLDVLIFIAFLNFHFSYPSHDQIWDHSYNSKCTPKILMAGSPPSGHHSASDSFVQLSSFLQFFICTDTHPRPQLLLFPPNLSLLLCLQLPHLKIKNKVWTIQSTIKILFIFTTTLWGGYFCYHPYFRDRGIEAQSSYQICSESHK